MQRWEKIEGSKGREMCTWYVSSRRRCCRSGDVECYVGEGTIVQKKKEFWCL
jgi:hypothetical protein